MIQYSKNGLTNGTFSNNESVGTQLHKILRRRIIENDLVPGTKLSESEIAKAYEISRQPAREAFIKLSEEGLIEILPQRGTRVRKIDISSVLVIQFIRESVEAEIVRYLASNASQLIINDLRECIADQKKTLENKSDDFVFKDEAFHQALADGANKSDVWPAIQPLKAQLNRVRFLSIKPLQIKKMIAQHEAIVDAIEKRDETVADLTTRTHMREVLQDLPEIQKKFPDYFSDKNNVQ